VIPEEKKKNGLEYGTLEFALSKKVAGRKV
jgi:hypothetical protein